jgi:hypothetical protein
MLKFSKTLCLFRNNTNPLIKGFCNPGLYTENGGGWIFRLLYGIRLAAMAGLAAHHIQINGRHGSIIVKIFLIDIHCEAHHITRIQLHFILVRSIIQASGIALEGGMAKTTPNAERFIVAVHNTVQLLRRYVFGKNLQVFEFGTIQAGCGYTGQH